MGATENRRNCIRLSDSILWVLVLPTRQKETHTTQILEYKVKLPVFINCNQM